MIALCGNVGRRRRGERGLKRRKESRQKRADGGRRR